VEEKRPTITEILMAAEVKKKKYRYHPSRIRLKTWVIWIVICTLMASIPILVVIGISGQIQEDSANAFYNIKKEITYYYDIDVYVAPVAEDTSAQLAKTRSQIYQSIIFLFPLNVEFSPRRNPQSATATYFITFEREGGSRLNYTLTASLSIMDNGRNWRIDTIKAGK
jgi:hypothetical protein